MITAIEMSQFICKRVILHLPKHHLLILHYVVGTENLIESLFVDASSLSYHECIGSKLNCPLMRFLFDLILRAQI